MHQICPVDMMEKTIGEEMWTNDIEAYLDNVAWNSALKRLDMSNVLYK
jgi:hypothetical protein